MEAATDSMVNDSQLPNGKNDLNSTDPKTKRKSVSFVDEKVRELISHTAHQKGLSSQLIMDALNSTSMSNGAKLNDASDRNHQLRPNRANHHDKSNGIKPNGRTSVPFSNGSKGPGKQRYSGSAPHNGHSKGSHYKSAATNGAAKNAVIVYYNDPQAEINVDQLLTKSASESVKVTNYNQSGHMASKSSAPSNGHQHRQNGSRGYSHHEPNPQWMHHDNWRQKPSSKPEQAAPRPFNGQGGASQKVNGKANGQPKTNGKTNDTSEKGPAPAKSEPITIYYSTVESSEVIEHNLKQLQLKCAAHQSAPANGAAETATPSNGGQPVSDMVPPSVPQAAESSQVNNIVIKAEQMEVDSGASPATVAGDQYDVISGGVPIKGPILPVEGGKQDVLCMLVSHPGHFYVKFLSPAHDTLMDSMNHFYNSDEHIDLSVDVLKASQYFAACRPKVSQPDSKEWIRVQLLHVEGPELLNCLLIDEGGFGMFKISDLQPLYNQFRAVPKQAVRASLAGVIPKEIDWLPKQALEFKHLVANQRFHTGLQQFDQNTFDKKQSLEIELYFAEDGELKDKSVADIVVERDIASKK